MRRVGPFPPLPDDVRQRSLNCVLDGCTDDLRVFAYGSLMWDDAFGSLERHPARLAGYRRAFCVWTAHARGTPELPGLGLGLLPETDAICSGVVLSFRPAADRSLLDTLWDREMWTGIYSPVPLSVASDGGPIRAIAFVVNTDHGQYAGNLPEEEAARHIARAEGRFGTCRDYFFSTLNALATWTEDTSDFTALADLVRREIAR